jgi:uncharacterized Zn finger protein
MDLIWTEFTGRPRLDGYQELKAYADRAGTWERWRGKALDFVREEDHPEDSLAIYQERIEPLVNRTNNKAYRRAYELVLKVRILMRRLGREAEFDEYMELLRLEYKRKRNFMKLLDGME